MLRRAALFGFAICIASSGAAHAGGWKQNGSCPSCMDFVDDSGKVHAVNDPYSGYTKGPNAFYDGGAGADMRSGSYHCREIATGQENARLAGAEAARQMYANNYRLECQ